DVARRLCASSTAEAHLRGLALSPAADGACRVGACLPGNHHHPEPCRWAPWDRALQGQEGRDLRGVEGRHRRTRQMSECGRQARKSTRLNSSHSQISYAVFCLKKKKKKKNK